MLAEQEGIILIDLKCARFISFKTTKGRNGQIRNVHSSTCGLLVEDLISNNRSNQTHNDSTTNGRDSHNERKAQGTDGLALDSFDNSWRHGHPHRNRNSGVLLWFATTREEGRESHR